MPPTLQYVTERLITKCWEWTVLIVHLFFQEVGCKGKDTSSERDSEEDSDIERQSMMASTGKL